MRLRVRSVRCRSDWGRACQRCVNETRRLGFSGRGGTGRAGWLRMTILRAEAVPGDAGSNPPASRAPEPRLWGPAMRVDKPELRVSSVCFFWSKRKEHKIENLIALCPTCHTRFDRGEIDKQSILAYKHKLLILNSRYGDLEQRIVKLLRNPDREDIWILDSLEILIMYLLEDGIIGPTGLVEEIIEKSLSKKQYSLTAAGRDYISRWFPPERSDR